MASSLLVLLDDIATILDDVAAMSKVAAKKTAGVLGDDLALNANQVSGVSADRELPVVWAVAKGSFINKLILVPAALAISAFAPWAITPLLIVGGLFLCFEGFEKIAHKYRHSKAEDEAHHRAELAAVSNPAVDMVQFERDKIKGAIRTDFILSAEIVVITLGTVALAPFAQQVTVVSAIALLMTVGVYGLVAGIVKLDDAGLYLGALPGESSLAKARRALGRGLLALAPKLMKTLSVVGTAAMFLVGGGIIVHGWPWLHHLIEGVTKAAAQSSSLLSGVTSVAADGIVGVLAGAAVLVMVMLWTKLFKRASVAG
jgi:uncharacterized protein